jgi:hypothetical protein
MHNVAEATRNELHLRLPHIPLRYYGPGTAAAIVVHGVLRARANNPDILETPTLVIIIVLILRLILSWMPTGRKPNSLISKTTWLGYRLRLRSPSPPFQACILLARIPAVDVSYRHTR